VNQLKDILDQLKADTRDRSTMVMLLVAAAVLVVAVAWVAMGSSTTPMTPKPAPVAATLPAAPTRQVADHAAKERKRHAVRAKRSRPARDPFEAIYIETKTEQGSGKSESKGGASKNVPAPGSTGGGSSTKSSSGPTNTKESTPVPTKVTASVAVMEFGAATAEGQIVPLTLVNHKILRATKPANAPMLLEIVKINVPGKTITFKLGKEVHMVIGGYCEPSVARCLQIRVKKDVVVHFEWRRPGEETTVKFVVRISEFKTVTGSGARLNSARRSRRAGALRISK